MNLPRCILLGSLVANIVFAGLLWRQRALRNAEHVSAAGAMATNGSSEAVAAEAMRTPPGTETWNSLDAPHEKELVARLRAEGFPPRVVYALARLKIEQRFRERRSELYGPRRAPAYWREDLYGFHEEILRDPEWRAKRRALEREMSEAYHELWANGETGIPDVQRALQRRRYGDLAPAKVQALEAINKDYNELRAQVRSEMLGIVFPEDQAQLDLLDQEQRADLERTLTAEELEMYDLRSSPAANKVRSQTAAFDPSEDEFRALFNVQREYDKRYGGQNLSIDEGRELREAMVAEVLSPERFLDYQVKTSGAYRPLTQLVQQLELPDTAVRDVLLTQREIERAVRTVRADASLTTEQRDAELAVLAGEATAKLTRSLGEDGFRVYRAQIGTWLKQLPPPPAASTPVAPAPLAPTK